MLEVYKFIPHLPETPILSAADAAKFCVQLLLENTSTSRLVSVEIDSGDGKTSFSEFIFLGLCDLPMITSDINYITAQPVDLPNVNVVQKDLLDFKDVNIVVKSDCVSDGDFLKSAASALNADGFIISRESRDTKLPKILPENLQLIATVPTHDEVLFILQFVKRDYKAPEVVIKITSNVEEWLEPLKEAVKTSSVLVYSEKEKFSGIVGLIKCVRRELPQGSSLRCVSIEDSTAPPFNINLPFYELQLKKGLAINVFKNNQWGSYRHLQLKEVSEEKQQAGHCFATCSIKGDMSTLNWINGEINVDDFRSDPKCIKIQYSALNFRDVMQVRNTPPHTILNFPRFFIFSNLTLIFSGIWKDFIRSLEQNQSAKRSGF